MKIIGIVGWKNTGKTTLIEKLINEFNERNLTVSTIKHSHHNFSVDRRVQIPSDMSMQEQKRQYLLLRQNGLSSREKK